MDHLPPVQGKIASHPFDGSDATSDVILVSQDKTNFYAHKVILSLASPYFKDLFSCPTDYVDAADPLVPVAEDGHTLDTILRFCYPAVDPWFDSLAELYAIISIMVNKYSMAAVARRARSQLRRYAKEDGLRVFAIAHGLGWMPEAAEAADVVLNRRLLAYDDEDVPELEILHPRILYKLFKCHQERTDRVVGIAGNAVSVGRDVDEYLRRGSCSTHERWLVEDEPYATRSWLTDYCGKICEALRECPSKDSLVCADRVARKAAREQAASCVNCCKEDLDLVFDWFIPELYLREVEEALAMKFTL
ncbi:hypothetical protein CYLTODRAFT_449233 [Cylindrobasidium torrendii FP15055 ss-10]|uniref:BTB domain-containing protein n=1 Tax=Cylindrobasidium torrendii FP15055 ss-10 TaxID=1314674 RepID=A0A0D7BRG0_9AGAR|nr:hypothetical protein CYLTODRAFT_449233 [Cylindrobasidium torrendii FP15055 ss-10]